MALSIFDDKTRKPKPAELWEALGRSSAAWQALTEWLAEQYDPLTEDWNFAGRQWGWSLRLKRIKRTVLYLTPGDKRFRVGLVLGDKAVAVALKTKLPAEIVKQIKTARKYAEGRGIRLDIRFKKDLAPVKLLAEAKMAN